MATKSNKGVDMSPSDLLDKRRRIFEGDRIAEFSHNMIEERKRFSWSTMCDEIEAVYRSLVE